MDKFEFLKELGKGSYGRVDLYKNKATGEQVAIKRVKMADLPQHEKEKALAEVKLLSSLNHPNIVAYKDSFQDKKRLCIVMEYVDGGTLEDIIRKQGAKRMEENDILRIFVQILVALAYLHQNRVLHRDIKPQNVFMMKTGIVKLGDFGVARKLDSTSSLATTMIGTPYYLAPEVWGGDKYNSQADVWSLGCVLFEMCTLHKPFEADNAQQLFVAVLRGNHGTISATKYSPELSYLVDVMLANNPSERPTISQITKMPLIQNAAQLLVERHKTNIESPNRPRRLLRNLPKKEPSPPPKLESIELESPPSSPVKVTVASPVQEEIFEDDFVDIEDDFVDDEEEDDPFTISVEEQKDIKDASFALEQTLCFDMLSDESPTVMAESLRERLENSLGIDGFTTLYRAIIDCNADVVSNYNEKAPDSVIMARNLIQLESSMDGSF